MVRAIARIKPVHVACFADNASEMAHEGDLAAIAQSYCLVRRHKSINVSGAEALLTRKPISLTSFYDKKIADYVRTVIDKFNVTTIFVFSGQMAQYVPQDYSGRLIVDFVDMDSEKFASYAKDGQHPMRYIYSREARLLRKFEIEIANRANVSTFVSNNEVEVFRKNAPKCTGNVQTLSNGIDTSFYDPRSVALVSLTNEIGDSDILFTGQMDYPPNIEAVSRFATKILPQITAENPDARFIIVGRQPTEAVRALHDGEAVIVTGEVADVRPWLHGAKFVVAPLSVARGVQNKVLEAMAMEKPVFASSEAATGIDAEHGKHFFVSSDDDEMASQINAHFAMRKKVQAVGIAARRHVQDTMSWDAMLAKLPQLLLGDEKARSEGL
jgi:sugar transferase (PEP-CTERM/EpsH1 system associated)